MQERNELIGDIPFSKGEYAYIRKHIGEQIAQDIEKELTLDARLHGPKIYLRCAEIARGQK
jgi:hypothetical protein